MAPGSQWYTLVKPVPLRCRGHIIGIIQVTMNVASVLLQNTEAGYACVFMYVQWVILR